MNFATYFAHVAVCAVAVVIPGATNALILANGMRYGVRAGLLNVAGTQVGVGLMIVTVAIGLTSIVNVVGQWFEWIGEINDPLLRVKTTTYQDAVADFSNP